MQDLLMPLLQIYPPDSDPHPLWVHARVGVDDTAGKAEPPSYEAIWRKG